PTTISNQEAKLVLADDTLPYWDVGKVGRCGLCYLSALILILLILVAVIYFLYMVRFLYFFLDYWFDYVLNLFLCQFLKSLD
ncbi:hypothetical protein, partial [Campylobacter concisus]|uniref:hypothetical protein n=1 Tax=Campylobacter concisus TaxID=199 RepID=UPI001CA5BB81